jgi:diguanylate cyclase (GGDEF)-like protein/PAS domain S-box-containing protein
VGFDRGGAVTADKNGSGQAERLAVIETVKEVLAGSAYLPDAAPRVLEVVCEHLGWDVGVMSVVDAGTNSLHRVGSWQRATDDGGDAPTASTAALAGYLGTIGFPIRLEQEVLGTIELYSKEAKRPDDTLIAALEAVGAEVAEFIRRKEADDDPDTKGGKYRTIVEGLPAVSYTAVADEGMRTLYVSPQIKQMLGISPSEWRNDPTLRSKSLFAADRDRVLADYRRARSSGEPVNLEYRMLSRDGSTVWVRESMIVPRDSSGRPSVVQGIIVDITSQRQGEQNDAYRAYHDELTGLPNRPMFEEFIEQVLLRAGGHNLAVAALTLNLDDFQLVNSSLGHDGGDDLLRQVAVRLRDAAQEADLVARQEGDEFLLLLAGKERGNGGSLRSSADNALLVAEAEASRIQEALQAPFMVADNEFYVTASIGISIFPLDADDGPSSTRTWPCARARRRGPAATCCSRRTPTTPYAACRSRRSCARPSSARTGCCTTTPSSTWKARTWSAWRRCFGGATRTATWCRPASSSSLRRTWASSRRSVTGSWTRSAGSPGPGVRTDSSWTSASTCRPGSSGSPTWSSASRRPFARPAWIPRRSSSRFPRRPRWPTRTARAASCSSSGTRGSRSPSTTSARRSRRSAA